MASYNNPQPFVPTVPEFQPDLNSYQQLLSMKEAQYQAGYQKISGLYGSLYNSPMIREDNKEARSKYFDKIESDIKKLAGYDLSLEQNITSAQKIFKPLSDDPFIMKDIAFTKQVQSELGRAESLRNSVPKEGEPKFWEGGIRALTYQVDDFAAAPREKSLNMQAPRYTPFVNVAEKAMKWAKDMGLSMTTTSKEGGYIITTKNGQPMEAGLRDTFLSVFGNDAAVQEMYHTQAYLTRKDAIASTLDQYPSAELAEAAYLDMSLAAMDMGAKEVLAQTQPKLESIAAKKALAEKAMQSYTYDPELDKDIADLEAQLHMDEQAVTSTKANAESILQHVNVNGMGQLDLDAKRMRVDGASANYLMLNDLSHAAKAYSQLTMEQKAEADPFALASYNHSNSMAEIGARNAWDYQKMFLEEGIDPSASDALEQLRRVKDMDRASKGSGNSGGVSPYDQGYGTGVNQDYKSLWGKAGQNSTADDQKVSEDNTKKVKELTSNVQENANEFTSNYIGDLVSRYQDSGNPEEKTVTMGEIKKVMGEDWFSMIEKKVGGEANVVKYMSNNETTLRNSSGIEWANVYRRATLSYKLMANGKLLNITPEKRAEYQQLQDRTRGAYATWEAVDKVQKENTVNVVKFLQGKVEGVSAEEVARYEQDGKVVSAEKFATSYVNPQSSQREVIATNHNAEMDALNYFISTEGATPRVISLLDKKIASVETLAPELVQGETFGYREVAVGPDRKKLLKEELIAKRNELLAPPKEQLYGGLAEKGSVSSRTGPKVESSDYFSDLKFTNTKEVRMAREKARGLEQYKKINDKYYEAYNGNNPGVVKSFNGLALLDNGTAGKTSEIKSIKMDQANTTHPAFRDVLQLFRNDGNVPASYIFNTVGGIDMGSDMKNDDDARNAFQIMAERFSDPSYANLKEAARLRGELQMVNIVGGDPDKVGFTFVPTETMLMAMQGTKTNQGPLYGKNKLIDEMKGGISMVMSNKDAQNFRLAQNLNENPRDLVWITSSQTRPATFSQPAGGEIRGYLTPTGEYRVEGHIMDVVNGKIINKPFPSLLLPPTSTGMSEWVENILKASQQNVEKLREDQRNGIAAN